MCCPGSNELTTSTRASSTRPCGLSSGQNKEETSSLVSTSLQILIRSNMKELDTMLDSIQQLYENYTSAPKNSMCFNFQYKEDEDWEQELEMLERSQQILQQELMSVKCYPRHMFQNSSKNDSYGNKLRANYNPQDGETKRQKAEVKRSHLPGLSTSSSIVSTSTSTFHQSNRSSLFLQFPFLLHHTSRYGFSNTSWLPR